MSNDTLADRVVRHLTQRAGRPIYPDHANPLVTKSDEQPQWQGDWAVHVKAALFDTNVTTKQVSQVLRALEKAGVVASYGVQQPGIYRWWALTDEAVHQAAARLRRALDDERARKARRIRQAGSILETGDLQTTVESIGGVLWDAIR